MTEKYLARKQGRITEIKPTYSPPHLFELALTRSLAEIANQEIDDSLLASFISPTRETSDTNTDSDVASIDETELDDEAEIEIDEDSEEVVILDDNALHDFFHRNTDFTEISLYFNEIRGFGLLSREEETQLFQQIVDGRTAALKLEELDTDLDAHPNYRAALIKLRAEGEIAKELFVRKNLRLVISIAKKYVPSLAFIDLIQEGNIGLLRAIDKYDPYLGNKFSTYATWWIRQAISRAIRLHSRMIRLPVHRGDELGRFYRQLNDLERRLERTPTPAEIATDQGITEEKVAFYYRLHRMTPISLDTPTGNADGRGQTYIDVYIDPEDDQESIEVSSKNSDMREALLEALANCGISQRSQYIIRLRFGLEISDKLQLSPNQEKPTLEELGSIMGITRERVRQLEKEGIARLKRYFQIKGLKFDDIFHRI